MSQLFLILFALCATVSVQAQVKGCKDPAATNYNAAATASDGSCIYNTTTLVPAVKVAALATTLNETSGLQWDGNNVWTFNDGGGIAAIYKIDTLTNAIWQTVYLAGASNIDWEDIAFDGTHFYIGDFGNNSNGARADLVIYKFPASAIPDHVAQPIATIPADKISLIRFSYADQPKPLTAVAANTTAYDCEAMLVTDNAIHLFTKNWTSKTTTHYKINSTAGGTYAAENIETLAVDYLVTGVDKSGNDKLIVLMGYNNEGFGSHYLHLLHDFGEGKFFNGNKRKISLPDAITMGQAEGLTFRNSTYGYISNERFERSAGTVTLTVAPKLRSFDISQLVPQYILSVQLKSFTAVKQRETVELAWQFDASVSNFSVQHSSDNTNYTTIHARPNTKEGTTLHMPSGTDNYYRLQWQDERGQLTYSKVITISGDATIGLEKLVFKGDGSLSFQVNSNVPHVYTFQVFNSEGRLLAKKEAQAYSQGRHTLSFPSVISSGTIVWVAISSDDGFITKRLHVQ